jgi:hypothetical protein
MRLKRMLHSMYAFMHKRHLIDRVIIFIERRCLRIHDLRLVWMKLLLWSTSLEKSVEAEKYVSGYAIKIGKEDLPGDLIMMHFEDYDLILGMDWLSEYHTRVDCKNKLVQFVRPEKDILECKGNQVNKLKYLISRTKACKLIKKGC